MKTLLSKNGYLVYKENITKDEENLIKKELNVEPITQFDQPFHIDQSFDIYRESTSRYRIPKYFGLKHFGIPDKINSHKYIDIDVEFNGVLNTHTKQDVAVSKAIDALTKYKDFGGGGILNLPPGFGKTTVSLYILCHFKVKTLIIVHKEFLMNQWIERIKTFVPKATIGSIRRDKIDIKGKDIVICMLQSLSMKDYDSEIFTQFGLTIIDETHHICSKIFSRAFFKFQTKYCLGLSGTPYRKDGLTKVIEWFIGPVFYSVTRENQRSVDVKIVKFNHPSYKDELPTNTNGKICIVQIISNVLKILERDDTIILEIEQLIKKDRNIMILSERREHCLRLKDKLYNKYGDICGLYMGGMKQKELEESELKQIIIATYSLAHEGLDIPKLDTLILASPKTDIVQACGRIMRETKGKLNNPYIIDIVDSNQPLVNQHRKRKVFYKKSGFNIIGEHKPVENKKIENCYSFVEDE